MFLGTRFSRVMADSSLSVATGKQTVRKSFLYADTASVVRDGRKTLGELRFVLDSPHFLGFETGVSESREWISSLR